MQAVLYLGAVANAVMVAASLGSETVLGEIYAGIFGNGSLLCIAAALILAAVEKQRKEARAIAAMQLGMSEAKLAAALEPDAGDGAEATVSG